MATWSWCFLGDSQEQLERLGFTPSYVRAWRNADPNKPVPIDAFGPSAQAFYDLREWAIQRSMAEPEELVDEEKILKVCNAFAPKEHVCIGVDVPPSSGRERWLYVEYVVIPMQEVIRKGNMVDLIWWAIRSDRWREAKEESPKEFLERLRPPDKVSIRFGFWDEDAKEELVAITWGTRLTQAFAELTKGLVHKYGLQHLSPREWEMTPEWGKVRATFFRTGTGYDVRFSGVPGHLS